MKTPCREHIFDCFDEKNLVAVTIIDEIVLLQQHGSGTVGDILMGIIFELSSLPATHVWRLIGRVIDGKGVRKERSCHGQGRSNSY